MPGGRRFPCCGGGGVTTVGGLSVAGKGAARSGRSLRLHPQTVSRQE